MDLLFSVSTPSEGVVDEWRSVEKWCDGESNPELGDVNVVQSDVDLSFSRNVRRSDGEMKSL